MESSVVVVPSSTDLVQLAPLGCGMQTGSGAVLNVIKAERPEMCSIVIFGMGAVGFSAAFASIQQRFKNIIAVDLVQTRLDQALDLGVQHALNGKEIGGWRKVYKTMLIMRSPVS
jgi:aryl-alcohol dehydrogenase